MTQYNSTPLIAVGFGQIRDQKMIQMDYRAGSPRRLSVPSEVLFALRCFAESLGHLSHGKKRHPFEWEARPGPASGARRGQYGQAQRRSAMVVSWSETPRRTISQATFDDAVRENMEEMEMDLVEAIEEARQQFQAQNVDLTGIRDTIVGEHAGVLDRLNEAIAAKDADEVVRVLNTIPRDEARALADAGLIGALLFLCRQHMDQVAVITPILDLLMVCTRSASTSSVPEPGLVSLLHCLRHHVHHVPIQRSGLRVLAQVIAGFEPHKIAMHSNGFDDYIRDVVAIHRGETDVFVRACAVLKRYLSDDDRRPGVHPYTFGRARELACSDEADAETGLICTMLSALKENLDNPTYVSTICSTLRCVAVTDAICQDLSQRALDDLIEICQRHHGEGDVAEKMFALFKILSRNDQVKVSLCRRRGLQLTILILEHHAGNANVVCQVLGTLSAVTLRQPENCLLLAENGVVPLLIASMSGHPGHIAIQRGAISTIRNMVSSSRTKELASLILEENAEELICKAHDSHEQCKDVAYAALRDLGRPYKATWSGIDT